jgi:hypothetical protein
MIVGGTLNGEYIDIVLPQPKVDEFIIDRIMTKQKVSRIKAKEIFASIDIKEWQKEFEKDIKIKFAYYINREINQWRSYDNYIREYKRRNDGL